jgi:hypothetical protein
MLFRVVRVMRVMAYRGVPSACVGSVRASRCMRAPPVRGVCACGRARAQTKHYIAAIDALEAWSSAEGMERHEEQVNCFAHVAHARQAMAALQEAAAAYQAALLVSKKKHADLAICLKVGRVAWGGKWG